MGVILLSFVIHSLVKLPLHKRNGGFHLRTAKMSSLRSLCRCFFGKWIAKKMYFMKRGTINSNFAIG